MVLSSALILDFVALVRSFVWNGLTSWLLPLHTSWLFFPSSLLLDGTRVKLVVCLDHHCALSIAGGVPALLLAHIEHGCCVLQGKVELLEVFLYHVHSSHAGLATGPPPARHWCFELE